MVLFPNFQVGYTLKINLGNTNYNKNATQNISIYNIIIKKININETLYCKYMKHNKDIHEDIMYVNTTLVLHYVQDWHLYLCTTFISFSRRDPTFYK